MAFNKVIIQGNISSEVELKMTQSGTSVCSFNVAVNRFSKEPDAKKVDFFTIVAWQTRKQRLDGQAGKQARINRDHR